MNRTPRAELKLRGLRVLLALLTPAMAAALGPALSRGAQEPRTTEDVLKLLEGLPNQGESWTSRLELTSAFAGIQSRATGRMAGKGTRFRLEMEMDVLGQKVPTKAIIDREGTLWMETQILGMTQVMKLASAATFAAEAAPLGSPLDNLAGPGLAQRPADMARSLAESFDLTYQGEGVIDGQKVFILKGAAKPGLLAQLEGIEEARALGLAFEGAEIAVGQADGFPRRIAILGPGAEPLIAYLYQDVRLGVEVDDAEFEYAPPPGVNVIDMNALLGGGDIEELIGEAAAAPEPQFNTQLKIGEAAPGFSTSDLAGRPLRLVDFRGKVVLVDFWATWSEPSVALRPAVIEAFQRHHSAGLEIISISLDDARTAVSAFLEARPAITWPQAFDGKAWNSEIVAAYGVEAIPFLLLIDRSGVVLATRLTAADLDAAIRRALKAD